MATVYVNTASVGGDGTTNNTSGATAAYSSLRQAILGEAADITGLGDLEILCDGGLDDEFIGAADWTGWTTTASDRIIIKTNPANAPAPLVVDYTKYHYGEVGTWSAQGSTVSLLEVGDGTASIFVQFGIQFRRDISGYSSGTTRRIVDQAVNTDMTLDGAVFDIRGSSNAGAGEVQCVQSPSSGTYHVKVFNSLFVGDQATSSGIHRALRRSLSSGTTKECYNNIFVGFDTAIENGGTNYAANNIFQDCVTEFSDATPDSNVRYNLTDNATINSSGTGDLVSKTITFAGANDFNLSDNTTGGNADVIAAGIGVSADARVPVLDAYGNTRSGATSDIGAYEYDQANVASSATIDVDIPSDIDLKWDTTHQLAVTHDGGTTTLDNVTLSAPSGWETVTFTTAPDEASTESFYEKAKTDATLGGSGYTMVAGDVLAWTTSAGLTIDGQTVPVVDPAATVTGSYKIWDDTLSTWSATSTYTITDNGIYTGESSSEMSLVQPLVKPLVSTLVH